ncbi:MAG: hypothetical protein IKY62_04725, partial [Clostridia bacterium]|nr:hypothetical protein [Clostridia bacterium]
LEALLSIISESSDELILSSDTAEEAVRIYLVTDKESLALKLLAIRGEKISSESLNRAVMELTPRKTDFSASGADIIIDTSSLDFRNAADIVLSAFMEYDGGAFALFSEDKLNFPDDEADSELISSFSEMPDSDLPMADAVYKDGELYIVSLPEATLARTFFTDGLIPHRLVEKDISDIKFVKMKNSL